MSDSENFLTKLPDMEATFEVDVIGSTTKQPYKGSFKCRILNNRGKSRAEVKATALGAGLDKVLDIQMSNFHFWVGWLEQAIMDAPEWWTKSANGFELYDTNVVAEVYSKVRKFEDSWREKIWGKPKKDIKAEQSGR